MAMNPTERERYVRDTARASHLAQYRKDEPQQTACGGSGIEFASVDLEAFNGRNDGPNANEAWSFSEFVRTWLHHVRLDLGMSPAHCADLCQVQGSLSSVRNVIQGYVALNKHLEAQNEALIKQRDAAKEAANPINSGAYKQMQHRYEASEAKSQFWWEEVQNLKQQLKDQKNIVAKTLNSNIWYKRWEKLKQQHEKASKMIAELKAGRTPHERRTQYELELEKQVNELEGARQELAQRVKELTLGWYVKEDAKYAALLKEKQELSAANEENVRLNQKLAVRNAALENMVRPGTRLNHERIAQLEKQLYEAAVCQENNRKTFEEASANHTMLSAENAQLKQELDDTKEALRKVNQRLAQVQSLVQCEAPKRNPLPVSAAIR